MLTSNGSLSYITYLSVYLAFMYGAASLESGQMTIPPTVSKGQSGSLCEPDTVIVKELCVPLSQERTECYDRYLLFSKT